MSTKLLTGKTAIITGANRGIGKAITEIFAENGASIIACVRVETEDIRRELAIVAQKNDISVEIVNLDLESFESVKAATQKIVALKRPVSILVNNAGVATGSMFQMTPVDTIEKTLKVNFTSQILFSQGISRYMSRFGAGSIINMSSVASQVGMMGTIAYGASKSALNLATKTMAAELGSKNIRVNAIAPSITKTDMFDQMEEKARASLIENCALKRAADPKEIANVALFLASDLSSYLTGQIIRVDGGLAN